MRVAAFVAILGLCALTGAAGPAAAAPLRHGNPSLYLDLRPGDGGANPDIVLTYAANTADGTIEFFISFLNRDALATNDFVGIFIDADRNAATGYAEGFEYMFQTLGDESLLGRWDGSEYVAVEAPSVQGAWVDNFQRPGLRAPRGLRLVVSAADLGNTTAFNFFVQAFITDDDNESSDTSPDGVDSFLYVLGTPHINRVRTQLSPRSPRASSRVRVTAASVQLASGEEVGPDSSIACRATLAGQRLRGTGAGRCTFTLPRTAKGKLLRITVTARFRDQTKTVVAFSSRVR